MVKERNTNVTYPSSSYLFRYQKLPLTGWFNQSSQTAGTQFYEYEAIDTHNGTDGRFRPCVHTRTREDVTRIENPSFDRPAGSTINWECSTYVGRSLLSECRSKVANPAWLTDSQWEAYDAEALYAMLPGVNRGESLVNFLIELKDFRRLATSFLTRRNRLSTLLTGDPLNAIALRKAFASRSLKQLNRATLKTVSGAYLNYSFAWAPLVSDVKGMVGALTNIESALAKLEANQGKRIVHRFRRPLVDEAYLNWFALSTSDNVAGNVFHNNVAHRIVKYVDVRYTKLPTYYATCRYKYRMAGVPGVRRQVAAYLDALGVRADPSIIWNAIPFSFLIDWVVGVGSWLRRFSVDNLDMDVEMDDFCSSVSYHATSRARLKMKNQTTGTLGYEKLVCQIDKRAYERRVGIPDLYTAVTARGLDARKYSLGAALLASRTSR